MSRDRDAILQRRQRFIGAALAAAGLATVLRSPGAAPIQTAEAQQPGLCLSVEPPYYRELRDALAAQDWGRAREALQKILVLNPVPRVFLMLGDLCAKMADHACARDAFRRYLHDAGDDASKAELRRRAEAGLAEAEAHVGRIVVSAVPAPDALTLDGAAVDVRTLAEPLGVNPGRHELVAKYGDDEQHALVELASGEQRTVTFEGRGPVSPPPMPCLGPPLPPEPAPPVRGCGCTEVGR
ncbi:MAG: hypothetical protein HY908_35420 [Myxococcales bacterium]|nr:hypothetical protein [Myxococcales bacterium]